MIVILATKHYMANRRRRLRGDTMKVKVIMNPVAGRGRALKAKPQILKALLEYNAELPLGETKGPQHATELARQTVRDGFDLIIIAGGDGTINQVVNGMGDERIPLGVIGCGTGNDFARAFRDADSTRWQQFARLWPVKPSRLIFVVSTRAILYLRWVLVSMAK